MDSPGTYVNDSTKSIRWNRRPDHGNCRVYESKVHDGWLHCLVSQDPCEVRGIVRPLWHLSVSFRSDDGALSRCPTWDELKNAKFNLVQADVAMVLIMPRKNVPYVNVHQSTLHLWESVDPEIDVN